MSKKAHIRKPKLRAPRFSESGRTLKNTAYCHYIQSVFHVAGRESFYHATKGWRTRRGDAVAA